MKQISINLYNLSELNKEARKNAIEEHRNFLLSVTSSDDFDYKEDYFSTIKDFEENDEQIIENIEMNDYQYYANGEMANCVTYCGKHPKTGTTELKIGEDIYTL